MSNIYMSLNGGLGNQLYIAATGISLSEILNQEIYFDTHAYKKYKIHKLLVHKLIPNIKVVPILKKVEETIAGTINNIEKGLDIPPVK